MKKALKTLFFSFFIACGLISCNDNDEPQKKPIVVQDTVSSTVLVYMIGQNNLSVDLVNNIASMATGMKNAPHGGNWLIYIDNSKAPRLIQLVKDENGNVRQDTLTTYPDQYSTDANVMRDVINDVYARFPADNYGLILSSHANGWFPAFRKIQPRSFGEEQTNTGTYNMEITDMADALAQVPHLKYILFDACLMGAVEIAYEFRNVADYFITSPASVINWGMPYNTIVPQLLKMTENDFITVLDRYYTLYQNYFGTLSLVQLDKMDHLAESFHALMSLESTINRANAISRNGMQNFEPDSYPHIYDFGQLVDSLGVDNEAATDLVKAAIAKAVLYRVYTKYSTINVYTQICYNEIKFCCGLTSYIPPASIFDEESYRLLYKKLEWFEASGWNLSSRF